MANASGIWNIGKRLALCLAALLCFAQVANAQNSPSDFAADLKGVGTDIGRVKADADAVQILPRYKAPPCKPNKKETQDRLDELKSQLNDLVDFGKAHIRSFQAAGGDRPEAQKMNQELNTLRSGAQASIDAKQDALNKAPVDPCPKPAGTGGAGSGSTGATGSTGASPGQQPSATPGSSGLSPPILSEVPVPGPAPKFCTEEEREKYLESLRHELDEANNNASKADEFRDAVRQPGSGYPAAGVQQAEREARERQRIADAVWRAYQEAKSKPLEDCEEPSGVGVLPGGGSNAGGQGTTGGGGLPQQAAQAESALNDAIKRCDRAAAEAAAARLRQLLDAAWENLDRVRFGSDKAEIDRASKEYSDLFNREAAARERLAWMLENCKEPSSTGFIPGGPPTIRNDGQILPPAGTPEQRAARLQAINQLRTGDANKSGTDVIPSLRRPDRDPSADARNDAAARMNEAGVDRRQTMTPQPHQPLASGPGEQTPKADPPPATNPPPQEKQPEEKQPTQLPDVEAEDAPPEFGEGKGTVGVPLRDPLLEYRDIRLPPEKGKGGETGAGQPPAESEGAPPAGAGQPPKKPRPSRTPRPSGSPSDDDPMETIPPLGEPENPESSLDELEELGAGGDLRPDTSVLDGLAIEFNRARDGCDLKTFLEVRARYIAELQRILSNPNLSTGARGHYESLLKAAEATAVPVRVSLPCPVLIR